MEATDITGPLMSVWERLAVTTGWSSRRGIRRLTRVSGVIIPTRYEAPSSVPSSVPWSHAIRQIIISEIVYFPYPEKHQIIKS